MWKVDDQMPTFKALSYRDRLRVSRCVARGEAPRDPRIALAAVELAESYQRREQLELTFMRWGPSVLILFVTLGAVSNAVDGDTLGLILCTLTALITVLQLMCDPGARPKNMARSLEASRQIAAAGGY